VAENEKNGDNLTTDNEGKEGKETRIKSIKSFKSFDSTQIMLKSL
jgi:hypothetical protein